MRLLFIGAFNQISPEMSNNSSVAGSKVQMEIIDSLNSLHGQDNVKSIILPELASWPKNSLFIKKQQSKNTIWPSIINIPIIKRILFSIQAFFFIIRYKPEIIFQYNTTLSMNFFMLFYKFFCKKRVLVLQDLNSNINFNFKFLLNPMNLLKYFGAKTIKDSFDFFIPISHTLIKDLNLPINSCSIWQGGVTSLDLMNNSKYRKRHIAVFAGALEGYNGIDLLVSKWIELNPNVELHIFGTGSLSEKISKVNTLNKHIKYHGFKSPDIVAEYVQSASLNFCLRYSKGIDQNYFFPSKFFDLFMSQGNILCNNFNNIPEDLKKYIIFLNDDLSNLECFLDLDFPNDIDVFNRKNYLLSKYTWTPFLKNVFNRLESN